MIVPLFALLLFAQQDPAPLKILSTLATALSEGNAAAAMAVFDKNMADYQTISTNIGALTSQADLTCSIDPVEQINDEVEVDWFLMIRSKEENGPTERRQVRVKITTIQVDKAWKIKAIRPITILNPPELPEH
jgi:hypothetical protein